MSASDVHQLTQLFKNALVYTTIIRNVDSLIEDKSRSIILIVMGSAVGALGSYAAKNYVSDRIATSGSRFGPLGKYKIIGELAVFLMETTSNVLVQLTSSLAATLATAVFSSADSLAWGLAGAFVSVVLLWLLQETIVQAANDARPKKPNGK